MVQTEKGATKTPHILQILTAPPNIFVLHIVRLKEMSEITKKMVEVKMDASDRENLEEAFPNHRALGFGLAHFGEKVVAFGLASDSKIYPMVICDNRSGQLAIMSKNYDSFYYSVREIPQGEKS